MTTLDFYPALRLELPDALTLANADVLLPDCPHTLAQWLKDSTFRHVLTKAHAPKPALANAPHPTLQPKAVAPLQLSGWNTLHHHWYADHTAQVDSGITLGELNRQLGLHNQWLPCLGHPQSLLIDYLASDWPSLSAGINPLLAGRFPHQWLLGQTTLYANGHLAQSGGRVMKNVSGFDMGKLHAGAYHAYGLITQVNLRLATTPQAQHSLWLPCPTLNEAFKHASHWALNLPAETILACEVINTRYLPDTFAAGFQHFSKAPWGLWLHLESSSTSLETLHPTLTAHNPSWQPLPESLWPSLAAAMASPPTTTGDNTLYLNPELTPPLAAFTTLPQHTEWLTHHLAQWLDQNPELPYLLHARPKAGIVILRGTLPNGPNNLNSDTHLLPWQRLLAQLSAHSTHPIHCRLLATHPNGQWQTLVEATNLPNTPATLALMGHLKHTYDPNHRLHSGLFPITATTALTP